MAESSELSGLWKSLQDFVRQRFDIRGRADSVPKEGSAADERPGEPHLFTDPSPADAPLADPNRLSVVVARFDQDSDTEWENLIVEALGELPRIQVLRLDRPVVLQHAVSEGDEERGHQNARRHLERIGASALVWGAVHDLEGKTAPMLHWTTSQAGSGPGWVGRYPAPAIERQLRLPRVFWPDLSVILQLLAASTVAALDAEDDRDATDLLPVLIAQVRALSATSADRPEWDADARAATRVILARALQTLGDRRGTSEPVVEAITLYRAVLEVWTRARVPLDWAAIQTNVGNALRVVAAREPGTARLEAAVAAYRAALQERTRERVPLDWAMTQNNLGNALTTLGEHEAGTARLEEAVAALRAALQERTRERVPLDWAMTQNNLGNALSALGEREAGIEHLEDAVAAYRVALLERTRERVPLAWAMTQNNLGSALMTLGEREPGTARLEEAVAAYRAALQERTRERVPLQWAMTQCNLGNALKTLGTREEGTGRLTKAVASYRAALEVFEAAEATQYVDETRKHLKQAQALLRERKKKPPKPVAPASSDQPPTERPSRSE